jgi:hypothetical protein
VRDGEENEAVPKRKTNAHGPPDLPWVVGVLVARQLPSTPPNDQHR